MNVIFVARCSVSIYVGCIDNIFYVGVAEVYFQNIEMQRCYGAPGLICPRSPPLTARGGQSKTPKIRGLAGRDFQMLKKNGAAFGFKEGKSVFSFSFFLYFKQKTLLCCDFCFS